MGSKDPRVDAYIARAAPFAQPILERLRAAVHAGCPGTEETIKWSMPFFMNGNRLLANMAAFRQHCRFGFWRGRDAVEQGEDAASMGPFGNIVSVTDLPPARELKALVQAAVLRSDEAAETPRPAKAEKAAPKAALVMPEDLQAALKANAAARKTYEAFTPGKQREYLEWVLEAKRAETRATRITQAIEWMAEGKSRNWKYQNC